MMIVSSPQPPDIGQHRRQRRFETAIYSILVIQALELLILTMLLVGR